MSTRTRLLMSAFIAGILLAVAAGWNVGPALGIPGVVVVHDRVTPVAAPDHPTLVVPGR